VNLARGLSQELLGARWTGEQKNRHLLLSLFFLLHAFGILHEAHQITSPDLMSPSTAPLCLNHQKKIVRGLSGKTLRFRILKM
jgi:hypothetical protein